ncbi:MAG TPA: SulP family inorganic anion transporter [Casimicrobiaceae bacterium]|nr:SulP family inorganic anion transporter [Casimicrobiaceae bacterium]
MDSRIIAAVSPRLSRIALRLFPALRWRDRVTSATLRADLVAGLVGALIVLPQAVAFATLAGMPPAYGLYGAMLPAVVGALWGSSWHLVSGPTNATSLMVFASLAALAAPFSPEYIKLVLTLTLMIGLIKLALGLARLGALVNFISITVIVGFTAGAGLLIIGAQLRNFFGLDVAQDPSFAGALATFAQHVAEIDPWSTVVGIASLAAALAGKRWLPRAPHLLTGLVVGSVFAWVLTREGVASVATLGALPSAIPSLSLPDFSAGAWRSLAPIALALTVIGLTEAVSSARAVAAKSGQRLDGNQEFVGQGLANIVGAFSSSYPTSGSFNRSGANFEAGARTPLAAVFSAAWLFVVLIFVAPLAAYLPLATMAALLFVVAWGLIDFDRIGEIAKSGRGELLVLAVTFLATLLLQLEFAILVGVLCSLLMYLNRTTHPAIHSVAPDPASPLRRFVPVVERGLAECPQLALERVDGSLFFGAADHVHEELEAMRNERPERLNALLIGSGVNFIDVAGGELLADEAKRQREHGGTLYLCNLKAAVTQLLDSGGFIDRVGRDKVFPSKDVAIRSIYARLDPEICRTCKARIFVECQEILPDGTRRDAP